MTRLLFLLPLLGLTLLPRLPAAPDQRPAVDDVVLFWNEQALAAVCADGTAPPIAARNLAIVHLAVHDAMARASGDAPLRPTPPPTAGATAEAAANGAAHAALTELVSRIGPAVRRLPASIGRQLDADGRAFGRAVAADVLRWRISDMRLVPGEYTPRRTEAGWEPTPPGCRKPLLPGWASVRPFVIPSAAEFRPHGPPPITGREFADSYRRVMAIGAADSPTRTDDQTEVAEFWADGTGTVTPPGHWNRIARTVVHRPRTEPDRECPAVRRPEPGPGRCRGGLLGRQIPFRLLAADDGHPLSGQGRGLRVAVGPGLAATGGDAPVPGVPVRAQYVQRGRSGRASGVLWHRRGAVYVHV